MEWGRRSGLAGSEMLLFGGSASCYDQLHMVYSAATDAYGLVSNLARSEVDVASGVGRILEFCNSVCPSEVWREIGALDSTHDCSALERWLHDLLEAEPPEESIVAFWFGLFDEVGPDGRVFTRLYVAGSVSYDPNEMDSSWACGPAYFPRGRYADSQVLLSASALLSAAGGDALELGSYAFALGYASLAVAEVCRQLPSELLLGRRDSRHVAVGFDSGDFVTLPVPSRGTLPV